MTNRNKPGTTDVADRDRYILENLLTDAIDRYVMAEAEQSEILDELKSCRRAGEADRIVYTEELEKAEAEMKSCVCKGTMAREEWGRLIDENETLRARVAELEGLLEKAEDVAEHWERGTG